MATEIRGSEPNLKEDATLSGQRFSRPIHFISLRVAKTNPVILLERKAVY